MNIVNTRIVQRFDDLDSWEQANPVLLDGELAVVSTDNQVRFKVGNGQTAFHDLPFIDQQKISTISAFANNLSVKSASVGYQNTAGTNSLAIGNDVSAATQHAVAMGRKAATSSNGVFVFNGDNAYLAPTYYDHGVGTFNVNAPLSDIYVQESSLNDILSSQELTSYLDKRIGGEVSGNVAIVNYDFKVLSGNYIQTNTPLSINNYSAANGFLQAESIKYGDPAIGSKAYCILSVIVPENAIIISGDLGYSDIASKQYPTQDSSKTFRNGLGNESVSLTLKHSLINTSNTNPCLSDLMWSMALFDIGDTNFGHLTAIQETTIEGIQGTKLCFDQLPVDIGPAIAGKSLTAYINDFTSVNGDNALYVRGFVELGNQIPPQFISQHVEGGAAKAIGKYTHAEGRDTIADGRYSHAEGTTTIAGGVASHAEGQSTHATGRSSHSEGESTRATMPMSHAEGYSTRASEAGAHAEGGYWLSSGYSGNYSGGTASGKASHAEGAQTSATGEASHAEGYKSNAVGIYSHAEGRITYAKSTASHAEGYQTSAIGGHSHAEGYMSIAEGTGSHAEGGYWWGNQSSQNSIGGHTTGKGSHAEGFETYAKGDASHAEGYQTSALCAYAHVEGQKTCASGDSSHAEGYQTSAYGTYSHAEGWKTLAKGHSSHAEGLFVSADADYSHAAGYMACTTGAKQWVWNGSAKNLNLTSLYEGAKDANGNGLTGTFCINPTNGINGFWIGTQTLSDILSSNCQPKGNYLVSNDIKLSYSNQTIWLSSKAYVTSVDCTNFIKDGMLSTVELCSGQLIFSFNTDAETTPISIALSNFIDETQYWKKTDTSSASELSVEFKKYQLSGDYLTAVPDIYLTYASTKASLSSDGYATTAELNTALGDIESILNSL